MHNFSMVAGLCALALQATGASAQGARIPPPKVNPGDQLAEDVATGADRAGTVGSVTETVGTGRKMLGKMSNGLTGLSPETYGTRPGNVDIKAGKRLERIGSRIGTVATSVDYATTLYREGVPGVLQKGVEDGTDMLADGMAKGYGPVGQVLIKGSYMAGKGVGAGINAITKWQTGQTLQDHATDAYFNAYEWTKHKIYPETDPMSAEFEAVQASNRASYRAAAAANAAVNAREAEAREAAAEAQQQSAAAAASAASFQAFMGALNGGAGFVPVTAPYTPIPQTSTAVGGNQCEIDPATGCHVGHDESSHPGGCKCGAGIKTELP
jgi:hypothetical protein